jgi:hypothetical protein
MCALTHIDDLKLPDIIHSMTPAFPNDGEIAQLKEK